MVYRPKYAKGEILVSFRAGCGHKIFAMMFGEALGYSLTDEKYVRGCDVFIYKTKRGKEKEACKRFEEFSDFVESAHLRDVKLDAEYENLEQAIDMFRNLLDDVPLPKGEYKKRLDDIVDYIQKIKK